MDLDFSTLAPLSAGAPTQQKRPAQPRQALDIDRLISEEGADAYGDVIRSIYAQESGSGRNPATSVDGARGGMQVIPATFSRVMPDGDPSNPEHLMRAGVRYAKQLGDRFGGDPARIAVGYFSGEGNVAADGDTPYIRDAKDGNGKSVSSYVADIMGRAGGKESSRTEPPGWADVAASTEFKGLSDADKEAVRNRYFLSVVAPTLPTDQIAEVRALFDERTGPSTWNKTVAEFGQLGSDFVSGAKQMMAGLSAGHAAVLAPSAQQLMEKIAALERSGLGDSPEAEQFRERLAGMQGKIAEVSGDLASRSAEAERYAKENPPRPVVVEMGRAKSLGETWEAFKKDPYGAIAGVTAQSAPAMVPALVAGLFSAPAAVATMAGSSGSTEFGGSLVEFLGENDIDVRDDDAVRIYLSDPENLKRALQYAGTRAGIIASIDAATMGLASKVVAPKAVASRVAREAINIPVQVGTQAAAGAGGEAAAQVATKGEIDQPNQVFMEAIGEAGGAPAEVISMAAGRPKAPPAPPQDEPPLPASDVIEQPAGPPIAGALPAPVQPAQWEVVDGAGQLPAPPAPPPAGGPPPQLPAPGPGAIMVDSQGNAAPQPAAAAAEATTRGAAKDAAVADERAARQAARAERVAVGLTDDVLQAQHARGLSQPNPEPPGATAQAAQPTVDAALAATPAAAAPAVAAPPASQPAPTAAPQSSPAPGAGGHPLAGALVSFRHKGRTLRARVADVENDRATIVLGEEPIGPGQVRAGMANVPITRLRRLMDIQGPRSAESRAGGTIDDAEALGILDDFRRAYKGAGKVDITLVRSADEVPDGSVQSGDAEGWYDRSTGRITIVLDNLSTKEKGLRLREVLAHELVGHHGIESLVRGADFDRLVRDVNTSMRGQVAAEDLDPKGRVKIGNRNYATVEAVRRAYPGASDVEVAMEVLARAAEIGAKPGFVSRLVAIVNRALRSMGLDRAMSRGEVLQLVERARQHVREGLNERLPGAEAKSLSDKQAGASVRSMGAEREYESFNVDRQLDSTKLEEKPDKKPDDKLDEDDMAMLQAELDAEQGLTRKPPDSLAAARERARAVRDVSDESIQALGVHAEEAFPPLDYERTQITDYDGETKDSYEALVFLSTGQDSAQAKKNKARDTWTATPPGLPGDGAAKSFFGLTERGAKDFGTRIAASDELFRRKFDLLSAVPKKAAANIAKAWRKIAQNPKAFEFATRIEEPRGRDTIDRMNDIARQLFRGAAVQVEIEPGDTSREFAVKLRDANGVYHHAKLDFRGGVNGARRRFVVHASDLERDSGMGKPLYQLAQALAQNYDAAITADPNGLLGVNTYRRTEQMFSGAARLGKSGPMQPGVGQRIYGWVAEPKTAKQHEENFARIALAMKRNVGEMVPEFRDGSVRYDLAAGQFTRYGEDAEQLIGEILKRQDVRAAGISRSTLARSAITDEAMTRGEPAADTIAQPVLYSRGAAEREDAVAWRNWVDRAWARKAVEAIGIVARQAPHDAYQLGGKNPLGSRQPVVMPEGVVRHIRDRHEQDGVTPEQIKNLPDLLSRPRAIIFGDGEVLVMLPARDDRGAPLMAALKKDQVGNAEQRLSLTRMASMYPKKDSAAFLVDAMKNGSRVWLPSEELSRARTLLRAGPHAQPPGDQPGLAQPAELTPGRRPAVAAPETVLSVLSDEALRKYRAGDKTWVKATERVVVPKDHRRELRGVNFSRGAAERDTSTPAFKKWFGDSKVVDESGAPLRVYTGTSKDVDFKTFKVPKNGVWFTVDPKVASDYAKDNDSQGSPYNPDTRRWEPVNTASRVIPAYLRIERAYTLSEAENERMRLAQNYKRVQGEIFDAARARGHDGVDMGDGTWVVIGEPAQIKSAIGNRGTFDSASPSIVESRGSDDREREVDRVETPGHTRVTTVPRNTTSGPLDWIAKKAGGTLVRDWVTQPLWNIADKVVSKVVPERVKMGVISDFGLSDEYTGRRTDRDIEVHKKLRQATRTLDDLAHLTRGEARIAYLWMQERPDTELEAELLAQLPEDSRQRLREMKQTIDGLGREAVRAGLLSEESYRRNQLAYLHRSYLEHEALKKTGTSFSSKQAAAVRADTYKGRGIRDDVDQDKLVQDVDEIEQGTKLLRVERRSATGKVTSVRYIRPDAQVPAGYAPEHVWEVRWMGGPGATKVGLWRDLTPAERQRLGEIDEVRFAFAKTIMGATRDIENQKFLQWIDENYARESVPEDKIAAGDDAYLTTKAYKLDEWVKVPGTTITGTGGLKKYGALADKYVPAVVWNDIRNSMAVPESELAQWFHALTRAWKLSKTALSPAVHANNVVSNVVLADLADVGAHHVAKALRTIIAAKRGDAEAGGLIERYEDSGAEIGSMAARELNLKFIEPLLKEIEAQQAQELGLTKLSQIVNLAAHGKVTDAMRALSDRREVRAAAKPFELLIRAYHAEDGLFRLAKFLREVELGASDKEAGKAAREAFLDYSINAPWIQTLRKSGLPFIAFSYRAIPLIAKALRDKPWKMAKYMTAFAAVNAMTYAWLGMSGEDEDRERRRNLPKELRGRMWGVFPRAVRMPWNDDRDQPVFLDARRWVPAGDVFDLSGNHSALPLPNWLQTAGPLSLLAELMTNKDVFTGKPIVKGTDTAGEAIMAVVDKVFKWAAPNLPLPGPGYLVPGGERGELQTYSWQNIIDAGTGRTDPFGRESSLPQAVAGAMGVKLRTYPEDTAKLRVVQQLQSEGDEVKANMAALVREYSRNGITRKEFDAGMKREQQKLKNASDRASEALR